MGVYIKGITLEMFRNAPLEAIEELMVCGDVVEVKAPHGRLIDADAFEGKMYHDAFETDTELQKWESGCWIRYKMLENNLEATPTVIGAEGE